MHNSLRKSVQLFLLLLPILSVCALRMCQWAPLPECPQSAEEWQQQWMLSFINELSQHSALPFPCFQSIYKGKTWLLPTTLLLPQCTVKRISACQKSAQQNADLCVSPKAVSGRHSALVPVASLGPLGFKAQNHSEGGGKKGKLMPLLFWLKRRNLGSYCYRQVAHESFSALLQETLSKRTSMYVLT